MIRLNTRDGGTDIIDLDCSEWDFLPHKYDIAAAPVRIDDDTHDISYVSTHMFTEPPKADVTGMRRFYGDKIGVGEDVFMIGLFMIIVVSLQMSLARGSAILVWMPISRATIRQTTGYDGESYIVDMHSRTGFSGSPVFVYRTFGSDLTENRKNRSNSIEMEFDRLEIEPNRLSTGNPSWHPQSFGGRVRGSSGRLKTSRSLLKLLGIHWGQFPEEWELRNKKKLSESKVPLILDGASVKGFSGMTCVIPASHILEVLNMPSLKEKAK